MSSAPKATVGAALGRRGEATVGRYLQRRGWTIVARNWRGGGGEIDIVATRRGVLLAVEVKLRTRPWGDPREVVTSAQRERIARALTQFSRRYSPSAFPEMRVDLIVVDPSRRPARVLRSIDVVSADEPPPRRRRGRSR